SEQIEAADRQAERRLFRSFQEHGIDQYIGSSAGDRVAELPFAAYWYALRTWKIVRSDVERSSIGGAMIDEAAAARDGSPQEAVWHAGLPKAPDGFPATEDYGIELNREEAEWIRDRILATVSGTLLAQLAAKPQRILKNSYAPWADPAAKAATGEAAVWLGHAEAYSALQQGLDAVYAYLVTAEARNRLGMASETKSDGTIEQWHSDGYYRGLLRQWDMQEFIALARTANPRIQPHSIKFLTRSVEHLCSDTHPAVNESLHWMVREREKRAKG